LHDIGRDDGLHRAPHQTAGHEQRQQQAAKGHQPPVPGLYPRRADTVVPDLGGGLVRCGWLRRFGITHQWSFETHEGSPYESESRRLGPWPAPPPSPPRSAWAVVVAACVSCCRRCRRLAHAGWAVALAASVDAPPDAHTPPPQLGVVPAAPLTPPPTDTPVRKADPMPA